MNEIILKLKMAGTNIKDEQELEEYLLNARNDYYHKQDNLWDIFRYLFNIIQCKILHIKRKLEQSNKKYWVNAYGVVKYHFEIMLTLRKCNKY